MSNAESDNNLVEISPRRALFVKHYCDSFNGTKAARDAGYGEKGARTTASRLLAIPDVKAAINAELDRRKELAGPDEFEALLSELKDVQMRATRARQFNAAARTIELRAKLRGFLRGEAPDEKNQINYTFVGIGTEDGP